MQEVSLTLTLYPTYARSLIQESGARIQERYSVRLVDKPAAWLLYETLRVAISP
ncbi:hypothetical protein [Nostoc sp.]|uniref:hypothetical protein n=1 Tax=Nostoc sp. TaxID=1180 RepID=UPI002FFCBB7B